MNKSDMYNLAIEYKLFDSERDLYNVYCAMNEDKFADFCGFLFLGDWTRNINVLDEEIIADKRVKELFEHIKLHCK